jgi:hypothetical protein
MSTRVLVPPGNSERSPEVVSASHNAIQMEVIETALAVTHKLSQSANLSSSPHLSPSKSCTVNLHLCTGNPHFGTVKQHISLYPESCTVNPHFCTKNPQLFLYPESCTVNPRNSFTTLKAAL